MARKNLHPTDDLLAHAEDAVRSLQFFILSVMPYVGESHGIALDTADDCVSEVDAFVKAYRKLYGAPVR
jgi:hypothetical protein